MATLTISFTVAIPAPTLGYRIKYRKVGDLLYTTLSSVMSSPVIITGADSGFDYEGTIESECSSGFFSPPRTFFAPAITPPVIPPTPCTIGTEYKGGKIAYLFVDGDPGYVSGECHGIVAALNDLGRAEWGCHGTNLTGAQGTAIGQGKQNTIDILAGCSTLGIAARLCDNYSITQDTILYDDWFLPSKAELSQLYLNRVIIGGFNTTMSYTNLPFYWTSAEYTTGSGVGQGSNVIEICNFSDGTFGTINKYTPSLVRPIRYF